MMRIFLTYTIFFLGCLGMMAQNEFVLTGKVMDEKENPVELASVSCVSQGRATITNLRGEFSLPLLSADSVVVKFSMIGYKTKTRVLRRPRGRQSLQIVLYGDNLLIEELTVIERKRQTTNTEQLDVKDMKNQPSASGNAVEELIQQQAGVSTHNELSSQYNVRGGAFDENSVYINNVEVYRPFLVRSGQQEGLSIINPDMVGGIGFSTGGYEAKYGDKMSSALDITYRKPKKFEATVQASLLGASGYIGFSTKKFSWANAVRYKQTKALLKTFQTNGEYDPQFIDYQTFLTYTPNSRWDISLIGNISQSKYNFKPTDRETSFGTQDNVKSFKVYFDGQERDLFRTFFGSLSVKHNITAHTSLSLIGSAFQTNEQETYDIQGQYWLTQTETSQSLGVGTYMEHTRNYLKAKVGSMKVMLKNTSTRHTTEAGLTVKWENITEKSKEYEMRDSSGYIVPHTGNDLKMIYSLRAQNTLDARRTEFYAQDSYKFSMGGQTDEMGNDITKPWYMTLNYGLRVSHWSFNRETIVSPRVSLSAIPSFNQDITFRVAAGLYYQAPFFKELRDTTTIDGNTYATLNDKIKSQRSIHFIGGMDYRFKISNRPFKFSAEAYYKLLANIVPYSVNNVKVVYYGTNEATGHIAGIDMKLYGEFVPGTDSWITFSLMNTSMKVKGVSVPMPTDQRYAINLSFSDYFPGTTKWKMNLKFAYADGLPFSTPHQGVEKNKFRAPSYQRADIGMSYRLLDNDKREKKKIPFRNIWLSLEGLNILGINNVNSYYWVTDVTNHQYAVPNYLTGRQLNGRVTFEF